MIYPWLNEIEQQLALSYNANRFHHGQLFTGQQGVGKSVLVEQLANALLCLDSCNLEPCGECKACHLVQAQTHPDKLEIKLDGQSIGVDDIRTVSDFMNQSAAQNGAKVVVINDCHKMTTAAANALLKTLEEPSNLRYLLLSTSHPEQLPATILSRCAKTNVVVKSTQLTEQWLSQHLKETDFLWLNLFYTQPLLVSHWQENDLLITVNHLYKFATEIKGDHNFNALVDILTKQPTLIPVFVLFLNVRLKNQLLQGMSFQSYHLAHQAVTEFVTNSTEVLGLNLSLAISRLMYHLQQHSH